MVFHILGRVLAGDVAQRVDGLVANHGFLHRGKALQRRQEAMNEFVAANQLGKVAQLFGQSQQDLIFVVDGVRQKRNEFGSSALDAESQGDRRQLLDAV